MAEVGNGAGRMYMDFDVMPDDLPRDVGTNYVLCKEDMDYDDLCTLEGLLSYFKHDASLDKEISNLKEACLINTINKLRERIKTLNQEVLESHSDDYIGNKAKDIITLMFYVKSEKVPEDKVDELLNTAIKNPMALLEYIDESDKSKYDVNISKYVEDVEGEW